MSTQVPNKDPQAGVPDRDEIRAALEKMRADFQALLASLSEEDWQRRYAASPWTVGQLLTHLTSALEVVPRELAAVRKGKNFMAMPPWLFNPIRIFSARLSGPIYTRRTIGPKFDRACARVLVLLDTVKDDEWQKGARFYDEGFWTIERIFRLQPLHFEEHAAEIKRILKR